MLRNLALAAALAAGGFAAMPAPAEAGVYIGVGNGYYGGYGHRYRGYRGYRPYRPYYRAPAYGYYAPRYRPRCRLVTRRFWDGYGYVTRTREVCGRRYRW